MRKRNIQLPLEQVVECSRCARKLCHLNSKPSATFFAPLTLFMCSLFYLLWPNLIFAQTHWAAAAARAEALRVLSWQQLDVWHQLKLTFSASILSLFNLYLFAREHNEYRKQTSEREFRVEVVSSSQFLVSSKRKETVTSLSHQTNICRPTSWCVQKAFYVCRVLCVCVCCSSKS